MQRPIQRVVLSAAFPTALIVAACASSACTSTAGGDGSDDAAERAATMEATAPLTMEAFRPAAPARDIVAHSPEHEAVLELLRDPAFPARFAQSWLSEVDIEPRVGQLEREAYQQILLATADENMELAYQLLSEQRGPDANALFDYTEGNLRYTAEDYAGAAEAFRTAVQKHPKYRRAWLNLALAHARLGNFPEAGEGFSRVIALGGGDATTYALLGIALTNRQDYVAAESAFRMAVLLDPDAKEWRTGLTECLFKQERYADAVALCESALRAEPERGDLWMLQANAYARLGQPRKAAENLEVLHGLGKATADSHNLLGDIYTNERLFDLARANYVHGLELAPDAGAPRAVRAARDLAARGALDESRAMIEQVEALAGAALAEEQRMQILKLRARIAVASGANQEQVRILEEIITLDPLDGEALLLLAQHYGREGEVERALLYYDRALGMEQHEAEASRGKAQVLVREGRYADALPLLRKAQSLDPRDSVQDFLEQVERFATAR